MSLDLFKSLMQNIKGFFLSNFYKHEDLSDDELECLQFGICTVQVKSPRSEELYFR